MKILITGDKGFVGAETRKFLEGNGHEIIGYDIMDALDVRDSVQFDNFVANTRPDRILHLAAIARFSEADKDPRLAFETNVMGTLNVSRVAAKFHIPLVYASTGSVYMPIRREPPITEDFEGMGNSVYGCTKYIGEVYVKGVGNPYIILRYAHLYGKEKRMHGLIGGFMERINRGLNPMIYGGQQSNSFTYIKDIAKANYLALIAPWDKWNEVYNIGSPEEITAEDAGKMICDIFGYKGGIDKKEARGVDPLRFWYNCSKAEIMLGFRPDFTLRQGLLDMAKEMGYNQSNDNTSKEGLSEYLEGKKPPEIKKGK